MARRGTACQGALHAFSRVRRACSVLALRPAPAIRYRHRAEGKYRHAGRRAGRRLLIGSQIGGGTGERVAAGVAGAAIGGIIGNRIGASMDDEDKQRAYAAQMQALETGSLGRTGRPGATRIPAATASIVPGPAYDRRGTKCRDYTHTIYIDGQPADRARRRLPQPGRHLDAPGSRLDSTPCGDRVIRDPPDSYGISTSS